MPGIGNLYVGGIYRPPNRSDVEFLSFIESVLQNLGDKRTVIMGDFNYKVMKVNDSMVSNYQNVFSLYNFVNKFHCKPMLLLVPLVVPQVWTTFGTI